MARLAVVGCGGWTQGWHLPHLSRRDDAIIVALVDPHDQPGVGGCTPSLCEPMAALCAKYSAARFSSVEALLAERSLALDGVLVAVPHAHHYAVARAVLEAGLHLLVEKPLTADASEAAALARLAAARPSQAVLVNNTANWQPGSRAAFDAVASGRLGAVRLVNVVFGAPLGWLFESAAHASWATPSGTMRGNGLGWGQLPHALAWAFKASGLVPRRVYAAAALSEVTGADLFDALTISCEGGATINVSGVGACPDHGFKVVGNWIFGTEGMLSYCGHAGSDNVKAEAAAGGGGGGARRPSRGSSCGGTTGRTSSARPSSSRTSSRAAPAPAASTPSSPRAPAGRTSAAPRWSRASRRWSPSTPCTAASPRDCRRTCSRARTCSRRRATPWGDRALPHAWFEEGPLERVVTAQHVSVLSE